MAIAPLSVQITERITTETRARKSTDKKEIRDAKIILSEMEKAASLQAQLGLGVPTRAVASKKEELARYARLAQAERLAEKFKAIHEPNNKFFPHFKRSGNAAVGTHKGRLPQLIMAELGAGVDRARVTVQGERVAGLTQSTYEAPIPVIPPTVLEKAAFAKQCAPEAVFHLLFMPSWEPAPQRDPVLVANVPDTDEWFEIGAWDGDQDLIKEFLENK